MVSLPGGLRGRGRGLRGDGKERVMALQRQSQESFDIT